MKPSPCSDGPPAPSWLLIEGPSVASESRISCQRHLRSLPDSTNGSESSYDPTVLCWDSTAALTRRGRAGRCPAGRHVMAACRGRRLRPCCSWILLWEVGAVASRWPVTIARSRSNLAGVYGVDQFRHPDAEWASRVALCPTHRSHLASARRGPGRLLVCRHERNDRAHERRWRGLADSRR